jgi:hypothetical protein
MNIGSDAQPIGRYIVDIDGSLRATDASRVSPADIIALHGAARLGSSLVWDRNGETIALGAGDKVELDESTVLFFRTMPRRRKLALTFAELHSGRSFAGFGDGFLHAAA